MKYKILLWARMMGFFLIVVGVASYLAACATLNAEVAPRVAQAVKAYCTEPQDERALIRAQVNQAIAPATIRVTCPGDSP